MNNVRLSRQAQADLAEIQAYMTEEPENPSAALAVVRRITEAIRTMRTHARIGTPRSAVADVETDYRPFLIKTIKKRMYHESK